MNFVGVDFRAPTEGGLLLDNALDNFEDVVAVYLVANDDAQACAGLPVHEGVVTLSYPPRARFGPLEWLRAREPSQRRCLIVFRLSDFETADELNAVRVWLEASDLHLIIPIAERSKLNGIEPLRGNEHAIEWFELSSVTAALVASGGSAMLRSVGSRNLPANDSEADSEFVTDAPAMLAELVQQVRKTARQVCRRLPQAMRQDAEGAAMVGLMEALRRFEDIHSQHFGNYLKVRVKGAIRDEARRFDPLSRSARELVNNVERVAEEHRRLHGRSPEIDEVARELGVDEDTCWQALELSEFSSLPIDDDTVSNSVHTCEDLFVETYTATALRWALGQLETRTRLVLRLWYKRGLPVAAIARRLGVSAARAHQIRVKGEQQLRQILRRSPPLSSMSQASAPFDWDDETKETRDRQRVS